jgi:hypothetical protein
LQQKNTPGSLPASKAPERKKGFLQQWCKGMTAADNAWFCGCLAAVGANKLIAHSAFTSNLTV